MQVSFLRTKLMGLKVDITRQQERKNDIITDKVDRID